MKDGIEKRVKIFIAVLIVAQGLYVVFALPDIWPLSNYSMFSKAESSTVTWKHEIYGLTENGREVVLDHPEAFSPLDRVRLGKGIRRILEREHFVRKQEKRVESVFGRLSFLPVDQVVLRETIGRLLPYKDGVAGFSAREKERDLRELFDYLFSRYERNRNAGIHDGPPVTEISLRKTTWDWTHSPPEKVVPETELLYSAEYGLIDGEK